MGSLELGTSESKTSELGTLQIRAGLQLSEVKNNHKVMNS